MDEYNGKGKKRADGCPKITHFHHGATGATKLATEGGGGGRGGARQ